MDFSFSAKEEAVHAEVLEFLKENPPDKYPIQSEEVAWGFGPWSDEYSRVLGSHGWLSRSWPREHGGQGRPVIEQMIFIEEMAYHRAPLAANVVAMTIAHAIMNHGNPELRAEVLPKMSDGTFTAWYALSEPEAGTDLAAVQTTAVKDGDYYVINGQKIWSAYAHLAKYGWLITRTNPNVEPSRGLSMFVLDKSLPGITVESLTTLAHTHLHNIVYLDNVRIPKRYLVGEENRGYQLLLAGLDSERFWTRFFRPAFEKRLLEELIEYAKSTRRDGRLLADDPVIRRKFAESATEIEASRLLYYELGWKMQEGIDLGAGVTAVKLYTEEMSQRFLNFAMELLGPFSQLEPGSKWAPLQGLVERWYLVTLGMTLAAGSSETLRDGIARRGLGLPRQKAG